MPRAFDGSTGRDEGDDISKGVAAEETDQLLPTLPHPQVQPCGRSPLVMAGE